MTLSLDSLVQVAIPFDMEAYTATITAPFSLSCRRIRLMPLMDADLVVKCNGQTWRGTETNMPVPRFYLNSDMLVHINGLMNDHLRSFIVSGTVTASILDAIAGSVVTNSAISLSYRASSDGDWWGQFPYTLALTNGTTYYAKVNVVSGGAYREWRFPIVAEYSNLTN